MQMPTLATVRTRYSKQSDETNVPLGGDLTRFSYPAYCESTMKRLYARLGATNTQLRLKASGLDYDVTVLDYAKGAKTGQSLRFSLMFDPDHALKLSLENSRVVNADATSPYPPDIGTITATTLFEYAISYEVIVDSHWKVSAKKHYAEEASREGRPMEMVDPLDWTIEEWQNINGDEANANQLIC